MMTRVAAPSPARRAFDRPDAGRHPVVGEDADRDVVAEGQLLDRQSIDAPRPVLVRNEHVVELGQEPRRRRRVRFRAGRVGQVEQLAPVFVPDVGAPVAAPRRRSRSRVGPALAAVGGGGGAERREVAQHQASRSSIRLRLGRRAQPSPRSQVWATGPLRRHRPRGGTWTSGTAARTHIVRASGSWSGQRTSRRCPSSLNVIGRSSTISLPAAPSASRVDPLEALTERAQGHPFEDRLEVRAQPGVLARRGGSSNASVPSGRRGAPRAGSTGSRARSPRRATRHRCTRSGVSWACKPTSPSTASALDRFVRSRRDWRASVARFRSRRVRSTSLP